MNRRKEDKNLPTTMATVPYVQGMVDDKMEEFSEYLRGSNVRPEQFALMAVNCVTQNRDLLKCSPDSFLKALRECADLRLPPSGVQGYAWIIPFGKSATMIPGWRGLVELARRSGEVLKVESGVAYEDPSEYFSVTGGDEPRIVHRPSLKIDRTKPGDYFYAIATLKNGEKIREWMDRDQVDRIRSKSLSQNSPMWKEHYNEAARKTVIRRLCKYLPMTEELASAIEKSDKEFQPEVEWKDREIPIEKIVDVEPEKPTEKDRKLVERALTLQESVRKLGGKLETIPLGELSEKALDDYCIYLAGKIDELESELGK